MAANPYFEIQGGPNPQRFELNEAIGEVVIGRSSDCQWAIPSSGVSRKHARIGREGREVTIEDLGSSNGTFVNGERLGARRVLRDRDLVRLGSVEIRFVVPEPDLGADATIAAKPPAVPPPPTADKPPPEREGSLGTGSTTRSVASPPTPAGPPSPAGSSAAEMRPPPSPPQAQAPAREPTPPWLAGSKDGTEPTLVELVAIAAGSFLLVFALGALLIRFVF